MVAPLHLQDNLSKIPLLQKIHEASRLAPEINKDQMTQKLKQKANKEATSTTESKEAEKIALRDKENKLKNKKKKRKLLRKNENTEEDKIDKTGPVQGQRIDIMV